METSPNNHLDAIEGVVKWFDSRKGYGFITGPQNQDTLVHYSVIAGDGYRALREGSCVLYTASKTDKGWKASKVALIPDIEVAASSKRTYSRTPRRS